MDHAVTPVPQLQALKPQTEQPSPGTSKASGVVANVPSKTANCAAGYHSIDRRLCSTSFGAMRVTLGGSIEQFTAAHLQKIKKDLSALWQIPSASIHLHAEAGSFVLEVVVDKEGLHGCELVKQFQSKWARYRETSLQKASGDDDGITLGSFQIQMISTMCHDITNTPLSSVITFGGVVPLVQSVCRG